MGCLRDGRQTRAGAEVAGQERGDLGQPRSLVREDQMRRGSAFGFEAGKPGGGVQKWVPDARAVPIDQHDPTVPDAQVVAPHVEVQQRGSLDLGGCGRRRERGQVLVEPDRRADPEREDGAGAAATAGQPSWPNWLSSAGATPSGGGVAWTDWMVTRTASTRAASHGGGHVASERSSNASAGESPSSSQPSNLGRNGCPSSAE
jgi:hypothetical protein